MDLHTEITTRRARLSSIHQRLGFENQTAERITRRLEAIEAEKAKLVKVLGLIDRAVAVLSANGVGRIETTVTNGLRLVFDDPTLALKVRKRSGSRGASYDLVGQQGEIEGPFLETFGGGIANVTSFLLRIILLKRFRMAKVLVLDEIFNNVSVQYRPMVSRLCQSLAGEGGFTILAVTHDHVLAAAADRIYRVVPHADAPPTLELTTANELSTAMAAFSVLDEEARSDRSPRRPEPAPTPALDLPSELPAPPADVLAVEPETKKPRGSRKRRSVENAA